MIGARGVLDRSHARHVNFLGRFLGVAMPVETMAVCLALAGEGCPSAMCRSSGDSVMRCMVWACGVLRECQLTSHFSR